MNLARLSSIGATLAALVFMALWLFERSQHSPTPDTHRSLKALTLNVAAMQSAHEREVADLKEKLHLTTAQFNETSLDLRNAQARLDKLEFKSGPRGTIGREEAMALSGATGLTNRFANLIEPDGTLILANAELSKRIGEKLYFKSEGDKKTLRKTVHVDKVHPIVLQALDLDRETIAKEQEVLIELAKARQLASAAKNRQAQEFYRTQALKKRAREAAAEKERQLLQLEQERMRQQTILAQQEMRQQQERARASQQLQYNQQIIEQMRIQAQVEIARQNATVLQNRQNVPQLPTVPVPPQPRSLAASDPQP